MIPVLGRYKIVSEIGQGAMGTVYKAVDPIIDRTVAIKTINLNLSKQELEEYEARFQQEIKAAGRLNHPNIVTIYDVGKTESVAYMAMEYLEGRELKDIIASGTRMSTEQVVDIIAQVADGLWFAHQQDIVHRDVKPSNIMVLKGGIAKITDFGIARLPNSAVKTMTGLILGSPRYMSPEQVIGKSLDTRTDIFSLGVVLYESLTGMAPFDGDNVNAIMYATVNTTPPPPSTHNRGIPAMLDLIVAKAMAKAVDDRYQAVKEFARRPARGAPAARRGRSPRWRSRRGPRPPPPRAAFRHPRAGHLDHPDVVGRAGRQVRGEGGRVHQAAELRQRLRLVRRDAAAGGDDEPDGGVRGLHHGHAEDARLPRQDRGGQPARPGHAPAAEPGARPGTARAAALQGHAPLHRPAARPPSRPATSPRAPAPTRRPSSRSSSWPSPPSASSSPSSSNSFAGRFNWPVPAFSRFAVNRFYRTVPH